MIKTMATRGNPQLLERPMVGVSGLRRASEQAIQAAGRIGKRIAGAGYVLACGDAQGVDSAAQQGALRAGGDVAFIPVGGVSRWRARAEYRDLVVKGNHVVANEFDPEADWSVAHAHGRNRLIIRLALALVVVEAGSSGGSWQSGLACLQMGRPLFVVRYGMETAEGNERLIERGGTAISSTDELMDALATLRTGADAMEER